MVTKFFMVIIFKLLLKIIIKLISNNNLPNYYVVHLNLYNVVCQLYLNKEGKLFWLGSISKDQYNRVPALIPH